MTKIMKKDYEKPNLEVTLYEVDITTADTSDEVGLDVGDWWL